MSVARPWASMIPSRVIERKREGETLEEATLEEFLQGYLDGRVEEYQMAAFLMAVHFQGLSDRELETLVRVMLGSGRVLDLSHLGRPRVDKHSTGGVGDKVSLVLAPLAAELGLYVPMMSGRGLGHTGGTLDKLEAIPGFRTDLTLVEFRRVLEDVGCAMIGQTREIAPLDRRLYDLRNATGTVPSIPLIAASIMSKKLAEGLTALVLDVKVGDGAFIPGEPRALELALTMARIGRARGVRTSALLTAMDRPLGRAVGNALETSEAVESLRGAGPPDLRALVLLLAAEMLVAGEVEGDVETSLRKAEAALDGGRALERFQRLVSAQGGDPRVAEDPSLLPAAPEAVPLRAERGGFVTRVAPTPLGYGVMEMGGGRKRLGEAIDPSVGFVLHVAPGARVDEGEVLGIVHAAAPGDAEHGLRALRSAIEISEEPPQPLRPLVSHRVRGSEVEVLARS